MQCRMAIVLFPARYAHHQQAERFTYWENALEMVYLSASQDKG